MSYSVAPHGLVHSLTMETAFSDSCVSNRGLVKPLFASDLYPLKLVNVKCMLSVFGWLGFESLLRMLYVFPIGTTNSVRNGLLHARTGARLEGAGDGCKQLEGAGDGRTSCEKTILCCLSAVLLRIHGSSKALRVIFSCASISPLR